jgi:hypothetical protein
MVVLAARLHARPAGPWRSRWRDPRPLWSAGSIVLVRATGDDAADALVAAVDMLAGAV